MSGLRLLGTGRALPSRLVTNDDMSAIVETSDEWIASRTGIRQRYFCAEGESAETLAIAAAERALASAGIAKEEIGCVVCATSSATYAMPSMACQVHHALGLSQNIPVMDAGAACAGFLYAVEMARCLMLGGAGRHALVIGSEQMSRVLDMTDRSTCVLFGDGAGAAVLALDEQAEYASVFGTMGDMAIRSGGVSHTCMTMDGQAVFRFAVATIPRCVRELLDKTGLTMEQLDWVVCHQANERILDASARRLGCAPEKLFKNLDRYANTSAASIPIALDEMREQGLLAAGRRMALVGFGGGLTWAGLLMRS